MRWAIIGAYNPDSIEFHLKDSLVHLGNEVQVFDLAFGFKSPQKTHYWLRRFSTRFDEWQAVRLAGKILDYKPDIVIGVYRYIHPNTITIIKKLSPSTQVIHINPDQLTTLEQHQILASPYDFYFTKDPYMVKFMRDKAGLPAYYLPEAFNPRYHVPPDVDRKELEDRLGIDILLFGTMYPYRSRIIEQLAKTNYRIKLYGNRAKFFPASLERFHGNREIVGTEKAEKVVGAKIVFNCFHPAEIEGVNVKYFEIGGIGGFQLCDFKQTLSEYSPVDPARYSFISTKQAIEQIEYYMTRPEERIEIANLHRAHFLQHHTYEHRMKSILDLLDAGDGKHSMS